jgi:DAK2 domain fusion protein YloV
LSKRFIDGTDFTKMIFSGAQVLQAQVKMINALNVFPVPDGDTGTNMNMTLNSGLDILKKNPSSNMGKTAEVFARGLLMGARGNSGVILSQLFRGFSKFVAGQDNIDASQFAAALEQGVNTAYQAVVKPVEGTILTVSREAAQHGTMTARRTSNLLELMKAVLDQSKETLANTPSLLPVLKQAGVVDSGGQGLVCIYEGFYAALENEENGTDFEPSAVAEQLEEELAPLNHQAAQARFSAEEIEFPYDMEFFIHLSAEKESFDLDAFRKNLAKDGDSILVIADDDVVKVHVHTRQPGDVLGLAIRYGELHKFHIENMRDQHQAIVDEKADAGPASDDREEAPQTEKKAYGSVVVAMGDGIADIFSSLGVDQVLSGGQTMNPSTEDIVEAIRQVHADNIFVFPNNSNIILAAQQARELSERQVTVIPTVSIPQGMAAMFALQQDADLEENTEAMLRAVKGVKSGQVTFAVRDSKFDDIDIKEGDFLGIHNSKIMTSTDDILTTGKNLLREMISEHDEILTILTGADASEEQSNDLVSFVEESYPHIDIEVHRGGQPLYYFIFSVE